MLIKNTILVSSLLFFSILAGCSSNYSVEGRKTKVGRANRLYFDHSRKNWESSGPRPIQTTVWYPSKSDSVEKPWQMGPSFAPIFQVGFSALDAEILDKKVKYPLIVLSHGTGGASTHLAWLAEYLAANGYVVASVDHHGNTALEEKYYPHGFLLWWERPKDLTFMVNELLKDQKFSEIIEKGKIGAAGFSLGGYSVLALAGATVSLEKLESYCQANPNDADCIIPPEAPFDRAEINKLRKTDPFFTQGEAEHSLLYKDPRIKAVLAIAPALGPAMNVESLAKIDIPIKIVGGKLDKIAPLETNGAFMAENIPTSQFRSLDDVSHYDFLAECGWFGSLILPLVQTGLCDSNKNITRSMVHRDVARDALDFFDRSL